MGFKDLRVPGALSLLLAASACSSPTLDEQSLCGYQPGNQSNVLVMKKGQGANPPVVTDVGYFNDAPAPAGDNSLGYNRGNPEVKQPDDDLSAKFYTSVASGRLNVHLDVNSNKPSYCVVVRGNASPIKVIFNQDEIDKMFPKYMDVSTAILSGGNPTTTSLNYDYNQRQVAGGPGL